MYHSGDNLNEVWEIGAEHSLYHKEGNWYHCLKRFPGALCDDKGYVLFNNEEQYKQCPFLIISEETNQVHVKGTISDIPEYIFKTWI